MELLIVILAVGISALYLVRRFWLSFTAKPDQGCSEACGGCTCTSGRTQSLSVDDNECRLPEPGLTKCGANRDRLQ